MLDWGLLQSLLIIAVACSSVTVIFIQKTKKFCKSSHCITTYSLIVNIIFGILFSKTFSSIDYIKSLWVGLFSFLGADTLYKNLEGKLASYTELTTSKSTNNDSNMGSSVSSNNIELESEQVIGEITYE